MLNSLVVLGVIASVITLNYSIVGILSVSNSFALDPSRLPFIELRVVPVLRQLANWVQVDLGKLPIILVLTAHAIKVLGPLDMLLLLLGQFLNHSVVKWSRVPQNNLLLKFQPVDLKSVLVDEKLLLRLNFGFLFIFLARRSEPWKHSRILVENCKVVFQVYLVVLVLGLLLPTGVVERRSLFDHWLFLVLDVECAGVALDG